MSPRSGNAWAIMKAREKQKQQQQADSEKATLHKAPVLDYPSSITSRDSSFKSDHTELDQGSHHGQEPGSGSFNSSTTTTTEADNAEDPDQRVENEIRRSRVAALRTKFSLRDIGEEARKDQALSHSHEDDNVFDSYGDDQDGTKHSLGGCSGTTTLQNSFDEERLYAPGPKKSGVYPQANTTEDDANEQIDAMVLEAAQAPAARRGEYLNTGQGEIVKAQDSIQSLRAEREECTPDPFLQGIVEEHRRPAHPKQSPDDQLFTGTTGHGGSAPAPPDPSYQNTVSLEQQLFSHVQALHHHMNSVVGRLTKTFETSNNWTMDQVLRNVEAMSDTARLMNSRSVGQSENIMKLQRGVADVRGRVDALQVETRRVEERLLVTFRQEMGRLRRDVGALVLGSQPAYSLSGPDARGPLQGLSVPETGTKKQFGPKKEQDVSRKENKKGTEDNNNLSGKKDVNKHTGKDGPQPSTPVQKTETAYPQHEGSARKHPARESSGSPEPKSTRDRSLSLDAESENSQCTLQPLQKQKTNGSARSEQEAAKTPQRKGMFGFRRRRDTSDNQSSFSSSRFLRTPRRNKDSNKKASSDDLKKTVSADSVAAPSTPPVPKVPANLAQPTSNDENMSPSAIHPALRNPRQQQIMREREQRLHQQQARLQHLNNNHRTNITHSPSSTATALIHQPNLRGSRSHQSFRSKLSMTPSSSSSFNPGALVARRSPSSLSARLDSSMGYHGPRVPPPVRASGYISAPGNFLPEPPHFGRCGLHGHGRGHGRPLASSSPSSIVRMSRGTGPGLRRGSSED